LPALQVELEARGPASLVREEDELSLDFEQRWTFRVPLRPLVDERGRVVLLLDWAQSVDVSYQGHPDWAWPSVEFLRRLRETREPAELLALQPVGSGRGALRYTPLGLTVQEGTLLLTLSSNLRPRESQRWEPPGPLPAGTHLVWQIHPRLPEALARVALATGLWEQNEEDPARHHAITEVDTLPGGFQLALLRWSNRPHVCAIQEGSARGQVVAAPVGPLITLQAEGPWADAAGRAWLDQVRPWFEALLTPPLTLKDVPAVPHGEVRVDASGIRVPLALGATAPSPRTVQR
jgi:hypothetical protein